VRIQSIRPWTMGHILETLEENLRKISYLRTIFDNIWENTNHA